MVELFAKPITRREIIGWARPTGPTFARPDDKLHVTHYKVAWRGDGFREELNPSDGLNHTTYQRGSHLRETRPSSARPIR
jgi:hypothetical protein